MIYLASPYSGTPEQQEARFKTAESFVARALKDGHVVFSPIVYCHVIARDFGLPGDAQFWLFLNAEFMLRCPTCWVLTLPGWKESKGVTMEIDWYLTRDRPVRYVDWDGIHYMIENTAR